MAEFEDREHYIPLRKNDLAELLCRDTQVKPEEREPLRQFFRLVSAVFHFEYLAQLEGLKDAYAPFDPDSETRPLEPLGPEGKRARVGAVFEKFGALMERANFKKLSRAEVEKATHEVPSDWGLPTDVDLGGFERIDVYARGDVMGERTRRPWWKLWRLERIKLPVYSRVVMALKLRRSKRIPPDVDTDDVFLKVFKDVPKADLEMLLPGAKVKLSTVDRSLIAYPLIAGVALLVWNIVQNVRGKETVLTELLGALGGALVSWSAVAALGGYGYKSYYSYQVKKQDYNFRLTKSLYYQTLDSNTGVLMLVLDEAEEQECRETYLAYFCLWKYAPPGGWTAGQLDDYVELYLEGNAKLKVDFEIGDALAKLERLGLVKGERGSYRAVPLGKALEVLDWRWDNYFKYNNPEPEEMPRV